MLVTRKGLPRRPLPIASLLSPGGRSGPMTPSIVGTVTRVRSAVRAFDEGTAGSDVLSIPRLPFVPQRTRAIPRESPPLYV